jgi:hypothetical protein
MQSLKIELDNLGKTGIVYENERICNLINDGSVIKYEGQLTIIVDIECETIFCNGLFLDNEQAWIEQIEFDILKYSSESKVKINKRDGSCIVYKITNKINGLMYVGKSKNYFGFRWYQHFSNNTTTKFGKAIGESEITDWTFEILEQTHISKLTERERFWISEFDSILNGYNSK